MARERPRRPAPWIASPARLRSLARAWRARGERVAFVPTMGYLHDGHLSLVERAARSADRVILSVFVNPLQFEARADLASYPRDLAHDRRLLRGVRVDAVFAPRAATFYAPGHATRVTVAGVGERLEGAFRPGHFAGVATVVTKLLHVVEPDQLWLGQKDAQQVAVLRRMVLDLDFAVDVHVGPTVREADGLAMSSRNARLTARERAQAPVLYVALQAGRASLAARGSAPLARRALAAERAMRAAVACAPLARLDYARLVDPGTFDAPAPGARKGLLVVAARFPSARLIDNLQVPLGSAR
jgi:pantoate--beta-alanine ligase